jgi:hypothetical protein
MHSVNANYPRGNHILQRIPQYLYAIPTWAFSKLSLHLTPGMSGFEKRPLFQIHFNAFVIWYR